VHHRIDHQPLALRERRAEQEPRRALLSRLLPCREQPPLDRQEQLARLGRGYVEVVQQDAGKHPTRSVHHIHAEAVQPHVFGNHGDGDGRQAHRHHGAVVVVHAGGQILARQVDHQLALALLILDGRRDNAVRWRHGHRHRLRLVVAALDPAGEGDRKEGCEGAHAR
jgi:hypothetical protein